MYPEAVVGAGEVGEELEANRQVPEVQIAPPPAEGSNA